MKKHSVLSLLFALLSAAAVCIQGQERVRDTVGNPVQVNELYFIQPVNIGSNSGGGLVPAANTVLPFCPLGINQAMLPFQPGLPVSFAFANSITDTRVLINTDVTIEFKSDLWPVCKEYSKLWVLDYSSSVYPRPILIGGEQGNQNSSFKIEKAGERENTYELTTHIGGVGTIPGPWLGAPQLVVPGTTLVVKFRKVDVATRATSRVEKIALRMFPFY